MVKHLTLIRGLPGSGKSTMAKLMAANHVETDMWFVVDGVYKFKRDELQMAHEWCQNQVAGYMNQDKNVVVSNTFTQHWEMEPYLRLAEDYDYDVTVIRCNADFGSIHNVPEKAIQAMRERFEDFPGEHIWNGACFF